MQHESIKSQTEENTGAHRQRYGILAGFVLSASALTMVHSPGCSSFPERFTIDQETMSLLPPQADKALGKLDRVEQQLDQIEGLRKEYAILTGPFLALYPEHREPFNMAREHHRTLFEKVQLSKKILSELDNHQLDAHTESIADWARETEQSLSEVLKLIKSVMETGKVPKNWLAPNGFDYLRPLNNPSKQQETQTSDSEKMPQP